MSRIDHIEQHALEVSPQPEGFGFYRWTCLPEHGPTLYYELRGSIAPFYVRGPRKGKRNWRRMDKATRKTMVVTVADQLKWDAAWQERTGLCLSCAGEKTTWQGWSKDSGHRYQTCAKCKGTGLKA